MTAYEEFLVNQEIKKFQQELELHKKALEIACKDNGWPNCEHYLEKARKEK